MFGVDMGGCGKIFKIVHDEGHHPRETREPHHLQRVERVIPDNPLSSGLSNVLLLTLQFAKEKRRK